MKKIISILMAAGVIALVACGPSAEDKEKREKEVADSIAQSQNASESMKTQAELQDSANAMMDSTRMAADSAK